MATPRVFIIRHGETEWSLNGRHTGTSDIPLTTAGEARIRATGRALVGPDRLIVPKNIAHVYVSPRKRAQLTFELLGLGCTAPLPWTAHETPEQKPAGESAKQEMTAQIEVDERVCEWDYGAYEGVTSKDIQAQRKQDGLPPWEIWRDGCPDGESPEQITKRLDSLIAEIRERFHEPVLAARGKDQGEAPPSDVLVVAHGHILRALAGRWIGTDIGANPSLLLEAGGVGTLSYEHHSLDEPAILLGGAFMAGFAGDAVEKIHELKEELKKEGSDS